MASRKVVTTIYITIEQDRNLKLLSAALGQSVAALIRAGIDQVIDQNRAALPQQLGLELGE